MKKIYIAFALITVCTTIILAIVMKNAPVNPKLSIDSYEEIIEYAKDLPVYSMDFGDEYKDYGDELIADLERIYNKLTRPTILSHKKEPLILIVKAHNTFKQFDSSYLQNATVTKVVQGDETILGKEIDVVGYFGIIAATGTINANNNSENITLDVFYGSRGRNILIPDNEYVIFCEKVETSDYYDIPKYRVMPTMFGVLNITSDYSKVVENGGNYSEYVGSEFLVNHQKTYEAVLQVKHTILERLNIEMSG